MDCDILTKRELGVMIKHYGDASLKCPLPFIHSSRSGYFRRCSRFTLLHSSCWGYGGKIDALTVSVSKPITLRGVQHFGSEGGNYTVSLQVKDALSGLPLVQQTGTYSSEKDETYSYHGFDVMFNRPVDLEQDKLYEVVSVIQGPSSWRLGGATNPVEVEGARAPNEDIVQNHLT